MRSARSRLESLRDRDVPPWFHDAKLGIFIHWGLFSIPAFAPWLAHVSEAFAHHYDRAIVMTPYTEWYDNALRVPESLQAAHHARQWGNRPYEAFRRDFDEGLRRWNPSGWARTFRAAGARYVVLVTKHHDGYCLWPSGVAHPRRDGWSSGRDLVGELADAVRGEGLRFGVYYSGGIDWSFDPRPVRTLGEFVASVPGGEYPGYAEAQIRELVARYAPDVLWNDIAWPGDRESLLGLFADYYAAVPEGVVNDRWQHRTWASSLLRTRPGQKALDAALSWKIRRDVRRGTWSPGVVPPLPVHCDFRTPEYTTFDRVTAKKWEATRGMSPSFGYNRADEEAHYEDPDDLVRSFVDIVSKNGNLLLNVGPRGEDASIPEPQLRRLEILGDWLERHGEAIYGTRPCAVAEATGGEGLPVRFTRGRDSTYAVVLGTPTRSHWSLPLPIPVSRLSRVTRVATGETLSFTSVTEGIRIQCGRLPAEPAHAFRLDQGTSSAQTN